MESLIKQYALEWEEKAKYDPFWIILTSTKWKGLNSNKKEFFKSGAIEAANLFKFIKENKIKINFTGRALDFGCGIGRITRALKGYFQNVVGIDISPTMIKLARQENYEFDIEFILNQREDLQLLENRSFDFIYSNIVLQHLSNPIQIKYIKEFSRIIKIGGVLIMQIPSKRLYQNWGERVKDSVNKILPRGLKIEILKKIFNKKTEKFFEMNTLSEGKILRIAQKEGLDVICISYTNSTDPDFSGKLRFHTREEALRQSYYLSPMYFFRKAEK